MFYAPKTFVFIFSVKFLHLWQHISNLFPIIYHQVLELDLVLLLVLIELGNSYPPAVTHKLDNWNSWKFTFSKFLIFLKKVETTNVLLKCMKFHVFDYCEFSIFSSFTLWFISFILFTTWEHWCAIRLNACSPYFSL